MEKIRRHSKEHVFVYILYMWIGLTIFKYHLKYLRYYYSLLNQSNGCAILWGLESNKKDEKKSSAQAYWITRYCLIEMFALFWPQMVFDTRRLPIRDASFQIPDRLSRPSEKCQCKDCPPALRSSLYACTYIYIYISRTMDAKMILAIYIYIYRWCRHRQHTKHQHNGCHDFDFDFDFGEEQMSSESSFLSALFFFCFCPSENRSLDWQFGNLRVPGISESESGNNSEIGTITYRELATKQRHELLPRVLIAFVKKNEMESPL